MEALAAGAQDFLLKPQAESGYGLPQVADQLLQLVRIYGRLGRRGEKRTGVEAITIEPPVRPVEPASPPGVRVPLRAPGNIEVIAIGISTGGPNALRTIFSEAPRRPRHSRARGPAHAGRLHQRIRPQPQPDLVPSR